MLRDDRFSRLMRRGHATLLIVFSHVDIPPGRFDQFNTFVSLPVDLLFLNCPNNEFYLKGVPGLGDDPLETLRALEAICSDYSRVISFGNSMGGFGALLYGLDLQSEVLALAPEYLLGIAGGASNIKMVDRRLQGAGRRLVVDTCRRHRNASNRTRIIFGEIDFSDVVCAAALLRVLGDRVVTLSDAPHSIAPFIEADVGLLSFVKSTAIDHGDTIPTSKLGSLLEHRGLIRLGFETYVKRRKRTVGEEILSMVSTYDPAAHVVVQQFRVSGFPSLVRACNESSLNIMVHLAAFDADTAQWRERVKIETLKDVVWRYRRNSGWGEFHRFLRFTTRNKLLSLHDLVKLEVPEHVAAQICEQTSNSN